MSWGSSAGDLLDAVEDGTPRRRATLRPWLPYAVVALVAAAHTLLYVFAVPPWALEDEEQHVDYVLTLRDEQRPPHLDDYVHQEIVDSAVTTDRWGSLGLGQVPASTDGRLDPSQMGLEGYSYEAHQPPLYYVALVPLAQLLGDRTLAIMYGGRLAGVAVAAAGAVAAAALSARWAPDGHRRRAAWIGGLACALMPALAEGAARVNNDAACAVLVTVGVVCLLRLVERPDARWGLLTGAVLAAAILVKASGVVGLGVSVAVLGLLAVRGRLAARVAAAVLVPQVLAVAAWSAVTHARYDVWNSTTAVVRQRVRFVPLSWSTLGSDALERAATPYGSWGLGVVLTLLWLVFVLVGLVLWRDRPGPGRVEMLVVVVAVAAAAVAGLASLNNDGFINAFSARYLLFAYPILLSAAAAGWAGLRRPVVAWAPLVAASLAAVAFLAVDFLPDFPLRVG